MGHLFVPLVSLVPTRMPHSRNLSSSLPFVGRFESYIRSLPPGDRFIAGVLGSFVIISSVLGVYALERSFLVRVPAHGGSLTEGVVGTPRFVNPLLAVSDTDRDLVALTYAGLMGTGADGAPVPALAESYTISPSGTVYTFTLRQNAKFSDGTPVTADDVVYTVQKAQDPALKSPALADWANIRVETVDARTVRFTLPKPYAPFLKDARLGILPARLWRSVSDTEFPFTAMDIVPVGAGPFTVSDVSHGKNGAITAYHLSSFRDYVTGRPYLDAIHLVFYADQSALIAAIKDGSVDSAYGVATKDALRVPYARVFGVFFNTSGSSSLAKPEVRKALSLAVNRQSLVRDTLGGYALPLTGPVPALAATPADQLGNIEAAKAALAGAKWTYDPSQNVWQKGSQTLSVTIKTSNVPELKLVASSVKADWDAFGVPTTVELHDPSDLTQNVIRPRAFDALLFGEVIGTSQDLFAFWDSSMRADPGLNVAGYANKSVDVILERLRTERDPVQVAADIREASQLIANDYPAAFLYSPDFVYAVPADLHGVSLSTVATPTDRFTNVAGWYRNTELVWPFFARYSSP